MNHDNNSQKPEKSEKQKTKNQGSPVIDLTKETGKS